MVIPQKIRPIVHQSRAVLVTSQWTTIYFSCCQFYLKSEETKSIPIWNTYSSYSSIHPITKSHSRSHRRHFPHILWQGFRIWGATRLAPDRHLHIVIGLDAGTHLHSWPWRDKKNNTWCYLDHSSQTCCLIICHKFINQKGCYLRIININISIIIRMKWISIAIQSFRGGHGKMLNPNNQICVVLSVFILGGKRSV